MLCFYKDYCPCVVFAARHPIVIESQQKSVIAANVVWEVILS